MLKVGIIGTGFVAHEHAHAIAQTNGSLALVAAADTAGDRLRGFCEKFSVASRYADTAGLLADPDIDLVTVATPPNCHEDAVIAALKSGKYVLCEKPLAHSLASARRIAEAAANHAGQLSVSYQFRYEPQFRRLLWLVKNGWIGDLSGGLISRHSFIPRSNADGFGWWGQWSVAGGGVLITQLIHELDMLQLVMGPPISASAEMDTRFSDLESEDFVQAAVRFSGNRTVRCVGAVNCGYLGGGIEFRGPHGSVGIPEGLILDDPARQRRAIQAVNSALPDTRVASPTLRGTFARLIGGRTAEEARSHALLYLDIAESIRRGKALPISVTEAMASLELCMAMYESAIRGQEVTLPLGKDGEIDSGVRKSDYDSRKCSVSLTAPAVFRRAERTAPITVRNVVVGAVKRTMTLFDIEPASVRVFFRKPAPVNGGPPVRTTPWPRRRHYDARERRAALRLMNKEIRNGEAIYYDGPEEETYCAAFAKYLGGGYADAVNSGSNAVYIALRALGVEPGSEIVVPPVTDPGGAMPVVLNLCIPVPADSAPGSIMPTSEQIEKVISDRTSAIIVSHMGGHPVDMNPILELAAERGLPVIEDCAQAHGALYNGRMTGSLGTISAFSTMFTKHHSTGGQGGVIFTQDPILYARAKQIADRGKSFSSSGAMSNVIGSMNFNQDELSMAIGKVQLEKLPNAVKHRRQFAARIDKGLKDIEGTELIGDPPGCQSSYWYLMVRLDRTIIRCNSLTFAQALGQEGIGGVEAGYSVYPTDQLWHRNAAVFGKTGLPWSLTQEKPRSYELPNAHEANERIVRIAIHESLGPREARDLIEAFRKVARHYRV